MCCGIVYNLELPFSEQLINAWGKFQNVGAGEPYYKESNLNTNSFVFFSRYKSAFDQAYNVFKSMFKEDYESELLCREFKERLATKICDTLYFLIDEQDADY